VARAFTGIGLVLVLGAALAACTAAPPPPPAAPATYPLAARTVRNGEVPLVPASTTEGDTVFELIGLTTGLPSVIGSHAEWPAKGQFTRIRLVITNVGRNSVPFDANRQLLITSDGAQHTPDPQAMLIKRQPGRFDVGPTDRLEFDLYYDIAKETTASTLRAFGGPSLADFSDTTGVDIPIRPGPA
jgi:hypothetical protein